jgi:DNA-binding NarL/FixJ family response regulator
VGKPETTRPEPGGVRVLVVDDQMLFRRAAVALVRSLDGFTVIGEALSGEESVAMAAELEPDVVLMDVRLPGIDGPEATRRILAGRPSTRVLLISTYDRQDLPADYLSCGATAFVRKQDLGPEHLMALADGLR